MFDKLIRLTMKRTSPLHILAKTSGGRTLPMFYGVPEQSTLRDVVDDVKEESSKVYIYIFFEQVRGWIRMKIGGRGR